MNLLKTRPSATLKQFTFWILASLCLHASPVFANQLSFTYPLAIKNLAPNQHALINSRAWKRIEAAHEAYQQNQPSKALEHIKDLITRYQNNPVIVSHGLRLMLQLSLESSSTSRQIELAKEVLRLNSLPLGDLQQIRYLLAQLYMQQENFEKAVQHLQAWFKQAKKGQTQHNNYYLLAYAHLQNKDYLDAISTANDAFETLSQDNELLLAIKMNAALAVGKIELATKTQVRLIKINPQPKSYWQNWVKLLRQQHKNEEALKVIELMAQKYELNPKETVVHYQLLLDQEFPQRAALLFQAGLRTNKLEHTNHYIALLSQAWELAGHPDKALGVLRNARQPLNTKTLKRLVYLHSLEEQWLPLITLSKQYKKHFEAEAWLSLQLARAFYEAEQNTSAIDLLEQIVSNDTVKDEIKETAQRWLAYID